MFPKPAFGSNTSGFGSFSTASTTASPFGGFKPAASAGAFGAPPAFGAAAAAPQPATGGLFGSSNTTGGLFGGTATAATPAFGASTSGFGFGQSTSGGGLFSATPSSGLFGATQNTSAFGAKPAVSSFGFGGTSTASTSGGLFGAPAAGGLFPQQQPLASSGLFNTSGGFGTAAPAPGTAHAKYNPVVGTDMVVKAGASQNINIKHHCITCMKEYETKSLEELRLEDYVAGRKGGGAVFSGFQTEAKPLFGGGAFGQTATTTASSVFGGGLGASTGFGQNAGAFSFGGGAAPNTSTTGLFGAAKPAFGAPSTSGAGLFGPTTTSTSTFGAPAPSFGLSTQNQQSTGLFGAKPAATNAFGAAPAAPAFGFGSGAAAGGLFAPKPAQPAPAFGQAAPAPATAFGGLTGGFGTAGAAPAAGGLFGTAFKPPAAQQPTFGFNNTGLGGATTGAFNNTFGGGVKPGFGAGGGLFSGGASLPTFNTGTDSGLGGGMFNNSSTLGGGLGGLGGLGLGTGLNTSGALGSALGASAAGNVHEQILSLVARPYGDSPLFKDLQPDTGATLDETSKSGVAPAASAGGPTYRVPPTAAAATRLTLRPGPPPQHDKKSLFDGLEESDASLEDKLTLRPSRKRLTLRPKADDNSVGQVDSNHRSAEESTRTELERTETTDGRSPVTQHEKEKPHTVEENNNLDNSSYKIPNWLASPRPPISAEKEKPIDGEPTPRLYPNLDKELPIQTSDRRASWLTTKTLGRKYPLQPATEDSVRDLGLRDRERDRDHDRDHVRDREGDRERDKENRQSLSVPEDEPALPRDVPPHPTGVKLTRAGYYTIPSLDDMIQYMRPDGSCIVPHLTIGRRNYGNVYFDCEIDVAGLDLDALVHFMNKEITIYPDDSVKPPVGHDLNRRAIVTLDRVWPTDKTERRLITDPDRLSLVDFESKLRRVCEKHDTKFVEYRPQTGSWVFRVEHFSKYGVTDSDEEDELTPEIIKKQLNHQQLQTAAALPTPPVVPPMPNLGGLGGLGGLGMSPGLAGSPLGALGSMGPLGALPQGSDHSMYSFSGLGFSGQGKAFEMDTTEDNGESQSLYQDSHRALGVKSPTSELARLERRQTHHVQLMKASLYADTDAEMEETASVSTGDQQVPAGAPPAPLRTAEPGPPPPAVEEPMVVQGEEAPMPPLLVRPHTIVLKYHRKVPPFHLTVAGRMDAAAIADMSISRARHSRVGFAPARALAFLSTSRAAAAQPASSDISQLGAYVCGRARDDWSEPVVLRLQLGAGDVDTLCRQLETLLQHSEFSDPPEGGCPRLRLRADPRARLAALRALTADCRPADRQAKGQFGVSPSYYHEVFQLCEALWAADLENDGIPGDDEQSIVSRHRRLLGWLSAAGAAATDAALATPCPAHGQDETDCHSEQIWTLLLGGRVLEACRLAADHADYNMAALLAQSAGNPSFRNLLSRQLTLWQESGADTLISAHKLAALRLIAGISSPRDHLEKADWVRAVHATARYLCPQIPSLEQVIRTYESFFGQTEIEDEPTDLSIVGESGTDDMGMKYPLPPYVGEFDVSVTNNGASRRVLDLRYELIRARAFNTKPKLQPASYTPDPMDYSLCLILGLWFGSAGGASAVGAAEQLAAAGHWHRAVLVLAFHPDDHARSHLIRGVLSRHAPSRALTPEDEERLALVGRLRLPEEWLLTAQAHRAKYERLPAVEAALLVSAGAWAAAHRVLVDDLLPHAVLSDNVQSIAPLVVSLAAAARGVAGWRAGGQPAHLYLTVCQQIRGLVSATTAGDARAAAGGLEALRGPLAAACKALGEMEAKTAPQRAARAEMGARLVQLSLAAGASAGQLAALLKALRLPPDTTYHAHQKITADLAEQASELCIDSAASSPISSHMRPAVVS